ncbi:MAG: hypothetical protein K2M64_02390, partial [Clostridia bacterium]|nr:hypothetical protein [Clostridia bacterium]
FTTDKIINEKYKGFYFQVNVAEMYFIFVNHNDRQAASLKWFYENNKITENKIEELDNNVTDEQMLENECDFIISKIFVQNGFIDQCINEYERKLAK